MATIYNSDLSKELIQGGRLQVNTDRVPSELADKVVPVMEVNPKLLRRADLFLTTSSVISGSLNVSSGSSTNRRAFITSGVLSIVKDAACDIATGVVNLVAVSALTGATIYLTRVCVLTLTAERIDIVFEFPVPVEIAGAISLSGTFTLGSCARTFAVNGFYDNVSAA